MSIRMKPWLRGASLLALAGVLLALAAVGTAGGAVAAPTFTSWASAPGSVAAGSSITISASVTSVSAATALIDLEVYSPSGAKVFQRWYDYQGFTAGQTRTYTATWQTPTGATAGTHTVKIGVFSPGWGTLYHWNNGAAQFSVTTSSTPGPTPSATPTRTPTRTPTQTPTPGAATYFRTLPPGSALPSGEECAARVRRSAWEPRPQNATANNTRGPSTFTFNATSPEGNAAFGRRVNGNFTGTTDEIIQWGACKWGFDEDSVRAVAVVESWWLQSAVGDNGESFGLLQVREPYHPGTYPYSKDSTAFNVDYALAFRRSCFEGYFYYWVPAQARGDDWGCIGLWFAGRYRTQPALDYIARVQAELANRTWSKPGF